MNISRDVVINYTDDKAIITPLEAQKCLPMFYCTCREIRVAHRNIGGTLLVAQLVEALIYTPEGRGFDSRWCHWIVSLTIFPAALWPWG